MSVSLADAIDDVGDALGGIDGLRVFKYIPDSVSPPAAVVDIEEIVYDNTKARGTDRVTIVVTVLVGKATDRAAHTQVHAYMEGTSAIKTALDAIGSHVRVTGVRKGTVTMALQEFLGATFDIDYVA